MADQTVVSTANAAMVDNPLYLQPVSGDSAILYSAQDFRRTVSSLFPRAGVLNPSFTITQRSAGANFSIDISAFRAVIQGTSVTDQGSYITVSTGTVNLTTPSAPASGSRTHRVVAQILDKQATGTQYGWQFLLKEDTGSGVPALPANSIDLGRVSIAAGQASVQNAHITQTWVLADQWAGGLGGGAPVGSFYQTVGQNIPAHTWTDILMQGEEYDPLNGHSTTTTTSRYYAQLPGYYLTLGSVAWFTLDSNTTPGTIPLAACIGINGSNVDSSTNATLNTNLVGDTSVVNARPKVVWLNRGDYVNIRGRHQWSVGAMDTQAARADCRSNLQVFYLGG
ncbi:hypothetical protein ABZ215_38495 [Amycolatopsis sp. NPDC006131]|uniref:hypothetical protein n=1 Tax=Amycolatopsis sp. NPDC006131 TaxID=3156731 RepID=UPI0033A64DE6